MVEPVKKSEIEKGEERQAAAVEKVEDRDAAVLAAAAESGDAAVHDLLGHRVIAEQNQDVEALKAIDKKLGELLKK